MMNMNAVESPVTLKRPPRESRKPRTDLHQIFCRLSGGNDAMLMELLVNADLHAAKAAKRPREIFTMADIKRCQQAGVLPVGVMPLLEQQFPMLVPLPEAGTTGNKAKSRKSGK
jgi:hypothetical protein